MKGMDAEVYNAAEIGSFEDMFPISNWIEQLTPTENSVLHLHVGRPPLLKDDKDEIMWDTMVSLEADFIEKVLDDNRGRTLLWKENSNGDTPLHLAARFGRKYAVQAFVEQARKENPEEVTRLLRAKNKNKDTALHDAARAGHAEVVQVLVEADPDCPHHEPNEEGETPLYLAAERGCTSSVVTILDTCNASSLSYNCKGPCGRTALHAAVLAGDSEMVSKMLEKDHSLMRIQNDEGLTPLHLAAAERDNTKIFDTVLSYDKRYKETSPVYMSVVYIQDNIGRTALHIAIIRKHWRALWSLVLARPDSIEIADYKGQNVLHYAAKRTSVRLMINLLKTRHFHKLINDKDVNGNTPLHILAFSLSEDGEYHTLQFLPDLTKNYSFLDLQSYNKQNLIFGDILHPINPLLRREKILEGYKFVVGSRINTYERGNDIEKGHYEVGELDIDTIKKSAESRLVVAALIATISFTAGFTVPGGFDQSPGENLGMAIFRSKASFKVFLVSDTIAFTSSTLAILFYFVLVTTYAELAIINLSLWALALNTISLGALMIAFLAGVSATSSKSIGFLVAISAIFFFFYARLIVRNILLVKYERKTSIRERLKIFFKTL